MKNEAETLDNLKSILQAIDEVAMEAKKRDDLPRGAREALELICSLARYKIDVRGRDWQLPITD